MKSARASPVWHIFTKRIANVIVSVNKQFGFLELILRFMYLGFTREEVNPLNTKNRQLYLKTQFVPRSKHFSSGL